MGSVGKWWVSFKRTHQRTHRVLFERTHQFLSQIRSKCASFVLEPLIESSFKMYPEIWSSCAQPYTQWVLWEFLLNTFEWTPWVSFDQIPKYSWWSSSGIGWAHFDHILKEPTGFFQRVTSWVLWWVLLKLTHHLPTDHIKIKVVSKLRTCPPFAPWVKCE